jgi:hypothetical protein
MIDPEQVTIIAEWKPLTKIKHVQHFIGFINFFRRFIFSFSRIIQPITDLLKKENLVGKFHFRP